MKPWYVYILRCSDDSLYTGVTVDLEKRLEQHNTGTASKYTSPRRPVVLVKSEKYKNRSEAQVRESEIKKWSKQEKEEFVK